MVKWAPHTWSLKVSTMSTTLTVWSSTPSSPSAPSAEGFAPMSTSTAPWTTHCKPNHSNDNIYISRLLLLKWPLAKNKQPPLNTRMKTHNSSFFLSFLINKTILYFLLKIQAMKIQRESTTYLSVNFPQYSIVDLSVWKRVREKLITYYNCMNFLSKTSKE